MINRGWGIPEPKPDDKGRLFSFSGAAERADAQLRPAAGPRHLDEQRRARVRGGDTTEIRIQTRAVDVRNKWVVGIAVLVVVVVVAGIAYSQTNDSGSSKNKPLVIVKDVQRMTLQDTVTLNGTLARKELRKVTTVSQGRVSDVYAKDGSTADAGARLFALDGRDAIAEPGDVRFFRPLDAGDRGDDVLQLKRILAASGYSPGPMNGEFTEQTRFALAQWQAQHHYPGAVPRTPQTVTVSLGQGSGYEIGAQSSAGLTIPGGGTAARRARPGRRRRTECSSPRFAAT